MKDQYFSAGTFKTLLLLTASEKTSVAFTAQTHIKLLDDLDNEFVPYRNCVSSMILNAEVENTEQWELLLSSAPCQRSAEYCLQEQPLLF